MHGALAKPWPQRELAFVLPPALFDGLSALESPAGLAALIELPAGATPEPAAPSVVPRTPTLANGTGASPEMTRPSREV